jgi:hypothetical protein
MYIYMYIYIYIYIHIAHIVVAHIHSVSRRGCDFRRISCVLLYYYVSSYYYTLHLCPHTTIMLYMCPHTTIMIYMCPHITTYAVFHDAAAISDGSPAHEIAIARYLRLNRALIEPQESLNGAFIEPQ